MRPRMVRLLPLMCNWSLHTAASRVISATRESSHQVRSGATSQEVAFPRRCTNPNHIVLEAARKNFDRAWLCRTVDLLLNARTGRMFSTCSSNHGDSPCAAPLDARFLPG